MQHRRVYSRKNVFLWIFSHIPFHKHKELKPEIYCLQAKQPREGKANMTVQLHPKGREGAPKGNTSKLSAKLRQWGMQPRKPSQGTFYLDSIFYIPAEPLVCRVLESPQFFPSRVPVINNHNLADKRAIPPGSDKKS